VLLMFFVRLPTHSTIFGRDLPYLPMAKNPPIPSWIQMLNRITTKV